MTRPRRTRMDGALTVEGVHHILGVAGRRRCGQSLPPSPSPPRQPETSTDSRFEHPAVQLLGT